ncbi:MAG TPA: ornithine carbamoyltransferase [Chthonomonadaceae bacterium]|nr:ornithine carbamoyltransferase [Chthonomonadaceae bacterium]
MWQRFTERARRVVFFAQEEAGRLGENYVSTEHLLLGMIREEDNVSSRILDRMGVSLGRIRSEIERQVTRGDGRLGQDMQLTPRAKRVIDLAYDEARQLSNTYIGTEHLLLGLIREGEGLAGRVLTKVGVELERTRREVMALQDNDSGMTNPEMAAAKLRAAERVLERSTVSKSGSPSGARSGRPTLDTIFPLLKMGPEWRSQERSAAQAVLAMIETESDWRGKSLISLNTVSKDELVTLLASAAVLKTLHLAENNALSFLYPRTLALLFEKQSLRTRVSFEAGMAHLNGHTINLEAQHIGIGTREPVEDVAAVLSRAVDIIAARVYKHETVEALAKHATVPVINALSDREHPVQAFADLLTLQEQKGQLGNHLKMAYIGDGNNVLHALLLACAKIGVNLTAACPEGYGPDPAYVTEAQRISAEDGSGAQIVLVTDPAEAVKDADALYTDVWASMGQEEEKEARSKIFAPYQINAELVAQAKPDAIVLHCLPAHRGEEISADVMEAHHKVIMDQAENRMHTQKALIALILGL